MTKQNSISEKVTLEGLNIFNGKKSQITFHPANDNTGINFLFNKQKIKANLDNAYHDRPFRALKFASCLSLMGDCQNVIKVEHILASVYCLGIDNLVIELSEDVVPRFDFGQLEVVEALESLITEGNQARQYLRVKSNLTLDQRLIQNPGCEDTSLLAHPANGFIVSNYVDYPHKSIGAQHHIFNVSSENYKSQIMTARGIFFLPFFDKNAKLLRYFEKYHGIRDRNSLLIGSANNQEFINEIGKEGFYGKDEVVRHKTMDALGAIALMGQYFKNTEFTFNRSDHSFDLYALRKLAENDCFEYCE